jgi:hypothetical protein
MRLQPWFAIGTALLVCASCGAEGQGDAAGVVPVPDTQGVDPDEVDASPEDGTLLGDMIQRAANCDGIVRDYRAMTDTLGEIVRWARVEDPPPALVGNALGDAPNRQMPRTVDATILPVGSDEPVAVVLEPTDRWTSDSSLAAEDEQLDLWVGISNPRDPNNGADGRMSLVFATDGSDFVITGVCLGPIRDQLRSVFGDDATSDLLAMTNMRGADASKYYSAAADESAPTVPPGPDLPQHAPGLSEVEGVAEAATEQRRIFANVVGPPVDRSALVCAATDAYVGECAMLSAFAEDPETGALTFELVVLTEPGAPVRVVQLVGTTYVTVGEVTQSDDGQLALSMTQQEDGALTAAPRQ